MVSALCGVHAAKCSGTAHNSTSNSEQIQLEFTQVMKARLILDALFHRHRIMQQSRTK